MIETEFRDAYEALLERMPDPPPFDRIRVRTLAAKPHRFTGWQVAVVADPSPTKQRLGRSPTSSTIRLRSESPGPAS